MKKITLPHLLDLGPLLAYESSTLAGRHQEAQLQIDVTLGGSRPGTTEKGMLQRAREI
jgi:hypothetical protein